MEEVSLLQCLRTIQKDKIFREASGLWGEWFVVLIFGPLALIP